MERSRIILYDLHFKLSDIGVLSVHTVKKANVLRKSTCTHCLKTLRDSFHTFLTQFRYFDAILKPNSDLYFSVLLLFQRAGSTSLMNVNLKTQFRYPGITQPNRF